RQSEKVQRHREGRCGVAAAGVYHNAARRLSFLAPRFATLFLYLRRIRYRQLSTAVPPCENQQKRRKVALPPLGYELRRSLLTSASLAVTRRRAAVGRHCSKCPIAPFRYRPQSGGS